MELLGHLKMNRENIRSVVASFFFAGCMTLLICGKMASDGNVEDLFKQFMVESGDKLLEEHLMNHGKNTKYTSA